MSKYTKAKHVVKEIQQSELSPPLEHQKIVVLLEPRGHNLHLVRDTDDEQFLVSMPSKFRRNVWVKRGDFLVVEPISEGDKVKAEIVRIVDKEYKKFLKSCALWPDKFEQANETSGGDLEEMTNTNRRPLDDISSSSSDSE